jgi:hypothetical protein
MISEQLPLAGLYIVLLLIMNIVFLFDLSVGKLLNELQGLVELILIDHSGCLRESKRVFSQDA